MVNQRATYASTPGNGIDSNEMKFGRLAKVPPGQRDANYLPGVDSDNAHELAVRCCRFVVVNRPRISEPVRQGFKDSPHCDGIPFLKNFWRHDPYSRPLVALPGGGTSYGTLKLRVHRG